MLYIVLVIAMFLLANFLLVDRNVHSIKNSKKADILFFLILATGLFVRIICAYSFKGHSSDVSTFSAWADMIYKDGFSAFYKADTFTDYPPGYMYVLWIIGLISNNFNMSAGAELVLIKLPAIIADLIMSGVIYSYLRRKNNGNYPLLAGLIVFNPVVILNSSLWGQVDSIMTLFMVMSLICLTENKIFKAYLFFSVSVFLKPQGLIFHPLFLYYFYENSFHSKKQILKNIVYAIICLIILLIASLPFGVSEVIGQYTETISSYPYAAVNAFNYWSALSLNWSELTPQMTWIGMFFILVITLSCFYLLKKTKGDYFISAAFLSFSVFMFSVKMHERYAYPAVIMFFLAYTSKFGVRNYFLYNVMTVSQFFNTAFILFIYEKSPSLHYNSGTVILASVFNLVFFCYFVYCTFLTKKEKNDYKKTIERSTPKLKLNKTDYIIMGVIMFVYSAIAFYSLGDLDAPETKYTLNNSVTINLKKEYDVPNIKIFLASTPVEENNPLRISLYDENNTELETMVQTDIQVFCWKTIPIDIKEVKRITLHSNSELPINEIKISSARGETVIPENVNEFIELFDEQPKIPIQQTYMNSMYFDEIYHARTAYEFIHDLPVYEWTHPPLGKVFISYGIKLFGMTPFGWRFMGTLFGVLMIPLFYIISRILIKKRWLSTITTLLFTFDFMHFVQTRIATIDVYVTFFIMMMYLFMFIYANKSYYYTPFHKTLIPLLLSGIFMGLAIACKWTGVYAATGLAFIFFMTMYRRYDEYKIAKSNPETTTNSISHESIITNYKKYTLITLALCVVFFIIIPIIIYVIAYIPYLKSNNEGIIGIWKNQTDIFNYHSNTVVSSTHPYSSPWYSWPLMLRPIWYYSNSFVDGYEAGISAFGNPMVWWPGNIALLYCIYRAFNQKDKTALLLVVAYMSNYLPWSFVERTTFIYHYFPSTPFLVLMIGYSLYKLYNDREWIKKAAIIYAISAIILFALFYPVLSGHPVNPDYVEKFLRWLPGWVLI